MQLNTSLNRFRFVALAEGWSFIFLLCVAMPLKYWAHFPMPVKIAGWIHGMLFVAYGFTLIQVWADRNWKFTKVLIAFLVSFIPLGTFWLDSTLKKEV